MAIASKISAAPSLLGLTFVIRDILNKRRRKRSNEYLPTATYMVLHMSVADLGYCFWAYFLGS